MRITNSSERIPERTSEIVVVVVFVVAKLRPSQNCHFRQAMYKAHVISQQAWVGVAASPTGINLVTSSAKESNNLLFSLFLSPSLSLFLHITANLVI